MVSSDRHIAGMVLPIYMCIYLILPFQIVDRTLKTDTKALDLVRSMRLVLACVSDYKSITEKLDMLKDPLIRLLKQIIECSIFIREYIRHPFIGKITSGAPLDICL